jgi:hypothetical protein
MVENYLYSCFCVYFIDGSLEIFPLVRIPRCRWAIEKSPSVSVELLIYSSSTMNRFLCRVLVQV